MAAVVSINPTLFDNFEKGLLEKLAHNLAYFADSHFVDYPAAFGNLGGFERNPQAVQSMLRKVHIALTEADYASLSWGKKAGHQRRSDHFLIFVEHWAYPEHFSILAIITPKAHQRAEPLIPYFVEQAERFFAMGKRELSLLNWFSTN